MLGVGRPPKALIRYVIIVRGSSRGVGGSGQGWREACSWRLSGTWLLNSAPNALKDLGLVGRVREIRFKALFEECVGIVAYFSPDLLLTVPFHQGFAGVTGLLHASPESGIDLLLCSRVSLFEF